MSVRRHVELLLSGFYLSAAKLWRITADNQMNQSWNQVNTCSRHYSRETSRAKIAMSFACTWLAESMAKICQPTTEHSNEKQIKHEIAFNAKMETALERSLSFKPFY